MPKNNKDMTSNSSSSSAITANNNIDDTPAFENATVGFVYSLMNRDPSKRRIKPVESILAMDADLDDSESDDSDYNPPNAEVEDLEIDSDADADFKNDDNSLMTNNKNGKSNQQTSSNDIFDNDDSDDEDDEDFTIKENDGQQDSDDDDYSGSGDSDSDDKEDEENDHDDDDNQFNDQLLNSSSKASSSRTKPLSNEELIARYKKILICAVCLGEISHSQDEIVECDACGISVHELCYGISADDTESIHSDASSASTEPWFCDPCKAGIKSPLCELCPNQGGIYKITDNGRWVHMVCALYIPKVKFLDAEKLNGPNLSDIYYGRWGSKMCMFCEDERFCQTGVCIKCDAGMCSTYFHVTCAQREGLLTEVMTEREEIERIANCRLHSDRQASKKNRRNFYALSAKYRYLMKNKKDMKKIEDLINNPRTLKKLYSQRDKFQISLLSLEASNNPTKRTPRFLDASPSAMRRLINRCELAGFPYDRNQYLREQEMTDVRRKWYIQPAFNVEFVSYYLDREERIKNMTARSRELVKRNKRLKEVESDIFTQYNKMLIKNEQIKSKNDALRTKIRQYLSILSMYAEQPKIFNQLSSSTTEEQELNRIKLFKFGQKILKFPEMHPSEWNINETSNSSDVNDRQQQQQQSSSKNPPKIKNEFCMKECATCKRKDSYMMALCDSCHLYYHLHCLDPPLKRMPKKTRFGGWQCSNCTENEENEINDIEMNVNMNNNSKSDSSQNGILTIDNSGSNSDIGGKNTTTTKTTTTATTTKRRLRENPKTVSKFTFDHDESSNHMPSSSSSSHSTNTNKNNSNNRSRTKNLVNQSLNNDSSSSNFNNHSHNNRKGRKTKPTSLLSSVEKTSMSPTTTKSPTINSRKRKSSTSPDNEFMNDNVITENGGADSDASHSTSMSIRDKTSTLPSIHPFKRSAQCLECFVCKQDCQSNKQSVRCDNCGNDYHLACLKPPCTKNPKRRGYTWCCFSCEKNDQKRFDHSTTTLNTSNADSSNNISQNNSSIESATINDDNVYDLPKDELEEDIKKETTELNSNSITVMEDKLLEQVNTDGQEIKDDNHLIENEVENIIKEIDDEHGFKIMEEPEQNKTTKSTNCEENVVDVSYSSSTTDIANKNDSIQLSSSTSPSSLNSNVNATNVSVVDDINTVLNDIIMLEEEAQQQNNNINHLKKQTPTLDTAIVINNKHDGIVMEHDLEHVQMIDTTSMTTITDIQQNHSNVSDNNEM